MSSTSVAIVLSLIAGVAGAMQASVSGAFGRRIGVLEATAFSAVFGAIVVVVIAAAAGRAPGIAEGFRQPAWLWSTGLFGAFILTTLTFAPSRLGTYATVALLIGGQLLTGALLDAFGWAGSERVPFTFARAIGLVLIAAGAFLTLRR